MNAPAVGRGHRVRWTDAMLAELAAGCRAGWSMTRTASRVGVSENACRDKAREIGLWPAAPMPSGAAARFAKAGLRSRAALAVAALLCLAAPGASALERCRVTDGDTLKCSGEPVRVMGLDTPEKGYRARCPRERSLADRATRRMEQLSGPGVSLEPHGRDRYGRLLAKVYGADGADLSAVMIREGLAVEYHGRGKRMDWCAVGAPR